MALQAIQFITTLHPFDIMFIQSNCATYIWHKRNGHSDPRLKPFDDVYTQYIQNRKIIDKYEADHPPLIHPHDQQ